MWKEDDLVANLLELAVQKRAEPQASMTTVAPPARTRGGPLGQSWTSARPALETRP